MLDKKEKIDCCGCGVCASSCSIQCIKMKIDEEGFYYPEVDKKKCIHCGRCSMYCDSMNMVKEEHPRRIYGAKALNDQQRQQSSSGGIFCLLASKVIEEHNGIVYGAAFDEKWNVRHIGIDEIVDIKRLQGSKYVQSEVTSYTDIKKQLEEGCFVYFSGTPCQVAGLRSYLGKEYDNLVTQDLICHGVPSPKVWERYVQKKKSKSIRNISFRSKELSWSYFGLKIEYDQKYSIEFKDEDCYLRGFLNNLFIRPSCHHCRFKGIARKSDITLGDLWGCNEYAPALYDEKGTSLIFINSEKAQKLFDSIKPNIVFEEIKGEDFLKFNSAAVRPVRANANRDRFFSLINQMDIERAILLCLNDSVVKKRIRQFCKKMRHYGSLVKKAVKSL